MSRKTVSAVIGSFLVVGFALGAVQGCGSSSSSSTPSCSEICIKEAMCQADASTASATTLCNTVCAQGTGGTSGQGTTCTNASAMAQAFNNCFSMTDCTAFNNCVAMVPKCVTGAGGASGTGTGGTTGGGGAKGTGGTNGGGGAKGTGGAGGAGATATCAVCDKAASCCTAAGEPATTCSQIPTTAACNAATGGTQMSDIQGCQQVLMVGALLAPTAAACQ